MFKDREEAGEKLAERLAQELSSEKIADSLILAIPRGGVVVGARIKQLLRIPLDVLVTKKIPAPENEELAIGAVAEGGTVVWEEELVKRLGVSNDYRGEIVKSKVQELEKKKEDFRGGLPVPEIGGKVVIIVDDGVATGATIKAAIAVVRSFRPKEIIVAVPVIAQDSLEEIKRRADRVFFIETPEVFFSVGQFYENFEQVSDEKVKEVLRS